MNIFQELLLQGTAALPNELIDYINFLE